MDFGNFPLVAAKLLPPTRRNRASGDRHLTSSINTLACSSSGLRSSRSTRCNDPTFACAALQQRVSTQRSENISLVGKNTDALFRQRDSETRRRRRRVPPNIRQRLTATKGKIDNFDFSSLQQLLPTLALANREENTPPLHSHRGSIRPAAAPLRKSAFSSWRTQLHRHNPHQKHAPLGNPARLTSRRRP